MKARPILLSEITILNEYYFWLYELVKADLGDCSYHLLIKHLYHRDFEWSVPNDDNRLFDGVNLREKFCDSNNIVYVREYFKRPASVLEVLIALAYRCEYIMVNQLKNLPMRDWFWEMLSNAGLDRFTDDNFYQLEKRGELDTILNRIINRTYQRNGKGGLFPLKYPNKDQRKVELWQQMNAYLVENYYISNVFL